MGEAPRPAWSWSRTWPTSSALDLPAGREGRVPDADDAERGRRQGDHRRAATRSSRRSSGPRKDDICYATQNRQEAVRDLVPEADVVLVLGSQNSSNSKRLAEIARASGQAGAPDRRRRRAPRRVVRGRRHGADHGRGAAPRRTSCRSASSYLRTRFGATVESAHGPRGARQLPAAAGAAGAGAVMLTSGRRDERWRPCDDRRFGPADHGRPVSARRVRRRPDYEEGYQYELIDGRLYVSPDPEPARELLEDWLSKKLEDYADDHPDVINYVIEQGSGLRPRPAERRRPGTRPRRLPRLPARRARSHELRWEDVSPLLVAEVLVDGDPNKDLVRNVGPVPRRCRRSASTGFSTAATIPTEPTLIVHRRRGKRWVVTRVPILAPTYTTPLLPGFALLIDPRR